MKLLADFFPILLFFVAYKAWDIYAATAVAIAASAAQVGWSWSRRGRVEPMHLVTLGLIVVLGGATLLLRDETFIKWKPTVVNWLFAAVFLGSQLLGRRPLVQRMMARSISLPDPVWARLNLSWVGFFLLLGAANLYVAYRYDTDTWVNFKLFGMLGLTLLFVLAQALYLGRHVEKAPEEP
ncbi:MAG: septation protein A [Gammaproteobacteria bacterium]|nr:MAG: septation protein A [Gammaproteobacteria bacterium]